MLVPKPTVVDPVLGVTLVEGTEYTLSYANNTVVGTATATVKGVGNYTGSVVRNFSISKQTRYGIAAYAVRNAAGTGSSCLGKPVFSLAFAD